jgi:glycosyltransferase involved in cell wall biosynthesis
MSKPLVSVVMPVYNTANLVCKAINSVLGQTYEDVEVVVVDDGSTDCSLEVLQKSFNSDARVKILHKENGGASSARNEALNHINGEYITFLDSDDTFTSDAVQNLMETLMKNCADVAVPNVFSEISVEGVPITVILYEESQDVLEAKQFCVDHMITEGTAWRCSSVLYRADIIRDHAIRFSEGHTAEDYLFNLNVMRYANTVSVEREITLHVQKRVGSVTASYRPELLQLFLYIDEQTYAYLRDAGYDKAESRRIADRLLGRNVVTYFMKEISTGSQKNGFMKSYRTAVKEICKNGGFYSVLQDVARGRAYFSTKRKRQLARILAGMLAHRLYFASAICIRLI